MKLNESDSYKTISGTQIRQMLDKDQSIPEWFTYPEVSLELKKTILPLKKEVLQYFSPGCQALVNQP